MNIVYRSRILLIRIAKMLPFIICFIVTISYVESIYALLTEHFCMLDGSYVLDKPISRFISNIFMYEWYTIIVLTILAFSFETCIWNKLAIIYLCVNAWERDYFINIELYPEQIHMICIANVIISTTIIYKGIKLKTL